MIPEFSLDLAKVELVAGYTLYADGILINRFGRIIRPFACKNGYIRVRLWHKNKVRNYFFHRLLAEAFIPNPDNKPQVNHIDGDKQNNNLANLEWVTQSENSIHAYRIGLKKGYSKKGCKLNQNQIDAMAEGKRKAKGYSYLIFGMRFESLRDAANFFNVNPQTVLNRCNKPDFKEWNRVYDS